MESNESKDDNQKDEYAFWKNYRKELTRAINDGEETLEKTPHNVAQMAKEIGVKPTARYFNISPATVRNYIKKDL